jgi:DNA-binding HxlR family transcriptional regulator
MEVPGSRTAYKNLIHVIGDRWTANLIALAYHGIKRFDEFHRELPIATNVLSDRLKFLVREGMFVSVPYKERPLRLDYFLSEKGLALFPYFHALLQWGDKWCGDGSGPPMLLTHKLCSHLLEGEVRCDQCQQHIVAYRVHQDKVNRRSQEN